MPRNPSPLTSDEHTSLDSLDQWIQELSGDHSSGLSREEEKRLGHLIREGDSQALETLIQANLRFPIAIAKRYQHRGVELTDLIQEANLGLVIAARKFNPDEDVKFISYAVWWIRQRILQALTEQGLLMRIPLNRGTDLHRIRTAREELTQKLHREPSLEEVAEHLQIAAREVRKIYEVSATPIHLDAPIADGNTPAHDHLGLFLPHLHGTDIQAERSSEQQHVRAALQRLPPREARILALYYGVAEEAGPDGMTLEAIGSLFGITRERARQLKDRALQRIRDDPLFHPSLPRPEKDPPPPPRKRKRRIRSTPRG